MDTTRNKKQSALNFGGLGGGAVHGESSDRRLQVHQTRLCVHHDDDGDGDNGDDDDGDDGDDGDRGNHGDLIASPGSTDSPLCPP